MTARPEVSLVIVSLNRPKCLARLLTSLRFLQYPNFEVVVVADIDPVRHFPTVACVDRIKYVAFSEANISAARNLGIAQAAGQTIAFCDDDAVPEPSWLDHLVAGFDDPSVGAAGGFVRGRNGISFQWQGRRFDRYGNSDNLVLGDDNPVVLAGSVQHGIKTEGTNCAFRRQALLDLGGFDENFRYFLDETDLNYRLGLAGWKTAIVPLAQVHHGFAASMIRGHNRAPKSLFEIGASKAWFCKKHGDAAETNAELAAFLADQRRRLLGFMLQGDLSPFDVPRLLADLAAGFKDGLQRQPKPSVPLAAKSDFKRFREGKPGDLLALSCRLTGWQLARQRARMLANMGNSVTVFRVSPTTFFHRMRFLPEGFWLQSGGLFGRSDRDAAGLQLRGMKARLKAEAARLRRVRPFTWVKG